MANTNKDIFGQVLVALVTPMTPEGEVDWTSTEKHIDYVISNGAAGLASRAIFECPGTPSHSKISISWLDFVALSKDAQFV